MGDLPLIVLTATIWTYWFTVGAMVVRLRRKTRKLVGVVPEQRTEQMMWLVFVPLVAAWCALPFLALRLLPFCVGWFAWFLVEIFGIGYVILTRAGSPRPAPPLPAAVVPATESGSLLAP
jgi:hypothetical protein